MKRKHLYYAILNTIINIVFFLILILAMFTEIFSFSIALLVLHPIGLEPEPGITFNYVSIALDISSIIFIASVIGSWAAYFKKSKKYFRFFILLTWGFMLVVSLGYIILYLI